MSAASSSSGTASGRYSCPTCHYVYDPVQGCPHEGYPAGTPWSALPDDFACPQCAVREKPDFLSQA